MALTICTWLWGSKYGSDDVLKLRAGLRRHLEQPHKLVVIADNPDKVPYGCASLPIPNPELTRVRGCFARLVMFSPAWQRKLWLAEGERLVCMDLDVVVTGELDPLFDRPEPFVILQGANAANPCPYNGSIFMLRGGAHPEVWNDFSIEATQTIQFHEFPDDQGWLWHKLPNAAGWKVGPESGVYAFHKPGWPGGDDLPADARLVVFPGWRSPDKFKHLPWIAEHWNDRSEQGCTVHSAWPEKVQTQSV